MGLVKEGMMIGENYKITSDSSNVIVNKRFINTGKGRAKAENIGSEYWTQIAYLSTPKNALHWVVDHEILGTGLADLETVVAKIDELHALIECLEV